MAKNSGPLENWSEAGNKKIENVHRNIYFPEIHIPHSSCDVINKEHI